MTKWKMMIRKNKKNVIIIIIIIIIIIKLLISQGSRTKRSMFTVGPPKIL